VPGGVDEGVEFVIITSGTDVLNNICCSSPLMGEKLGEVVHVEVELQDWFIGLFSPFSSEKRKIIPIII
jgi:hypothetical protein